MTSEIFKPVAVLIAWTLVMFVWMIAVRVPAMKRAGIDLRKARGSKPGGLDGVIEEQAQWPAHNYIHLMEQPTIFYGVTLLLAVAGLGNGVNATLAWIYVGLRIAHSLLQATVNIIVYWFLLFLLSTIALAGMSINALIAVFYATRLNEAASSTWVDHRNWPTGTIQSST